MCIAGESESGHGGRFEPCEEYARLLKKSGEVTANLDNKIERLEAENTALRRECLRLEFKNSEIQSENTRLQSRCERLNTQKVRWEAKARDCEGE